MSEKCKQKLYRDWCRSRQCSRNAKKDGYCNQHHPDSVKDRSEKLKKRYAEKRKKDPWYLLKEARKEIAKLKAENTAQLEELTAISDALGTRDGHSSISHIEALKAEVKRFRVALEFYARPDIDNGKIAKQALKASE